MRRMALIGVAAGVAAAFSAPARAACQLSKYLELPVTMAGARPIVSAKISDKDARFILDSGAFYSTLSQASALEFGLKTEQAPPWFRLSGLNGDASVSIATVRDFGLAGVTLPRIEFLVGGTATGWAGLLGQNVLGIGDVEYDLPHGAVRLLRARGCPVGSLAYWAGNKPFTMVALDGREPPFKTHTIGTVSINGVKLRAVFDTGAPSSVLTLAAAKRAGVTPDSPGVEPDGLTTGLGSKARRSWLATFQSIDIGGEAIKRPRIRIAEIEIGDGDMLIGADFFMTHRIYVANAARQMLITYEGGPMFGLNPKGAWSSTGAALDLTDKATAPTDAEGLSRRGAVLASTGKLDAAIADFDKAVALAPADGRYLRQRAGARLANRQPLLAFADLDKAVALNPADADARMMRAGLKLGDRDRAGAVDDLKAADRALPPSADRRLQLASMFDAADQPDAAIGSYDLWLKSHSEDAARPSALNGRCWARALVNRELDRALEDCNAAIKARPNTPAFLDSRGLVRLRRGELKLALADYDTALAGPDRSPWSLYSRSIVKKRLGDGAGAAADRAAALKEDGSVIERGKKLGLES